MTDRGTIAWIAVTGQGLARARRLREHLRTGEVYRPERYGASDGWEHAYAGPLAQVVPDLFARFEHLVFFLAAGAATRLVAPCLGSKATDPGVIVVDEVGQFVVPILSGHEGGANALARRVAAAIGGTPVVTTGSESAGGLVLSELEEAFGWLPEPRDRYKATAMALLEGAPVAVIQEVGDRRTWLDRRELPPNVTFATDVERLPRAGYERFVWVTDRLPDVPSWVGEDRVLWYRPRSLVLGVGCERGVSTEAAEECVRRVLSGHGFAAASVGTLASLDVKSNEPAFLEMAERHGWDTSFFTSGDLARVPGVANSSQTVEECVGTPGVAEPAALLASGADHLLVEKQVVASPLSPKRMTVALARSSVFGPREAAGGRVVFVGAGPGDPDLMTVKADALLRRADVVIYAGSLVPDELVRRAPAHAALYNSAHMTLEEVAEVLVSSARAGRLVVRLQSGDPSLYSATQEQMTILDEAGVPFEVIPGISSYQAAAAALRTELTLPEVAQTVILTRGEGKTPMPGAESLALLAAHRATLCVFLSARLARKVQDQLLTAYPPETPVAILYRVSWPDEKIVMTDLAHLAEEVHRHRLTRTTLFLIGQAIGGRKNRSRLYDKDHGHLFRRRTRGPQDPAP